MQYLNEFAGKKKKKRQLADKLTINLKLGLWLHVLKNDSLQNKMRNVFKLSVGCDFRSSGVDHDLLLLDRDPRAVEVQQEHGTPHEQQHSQVRRLPLSFQ